MTPRAAAGLALVGLVAVTVAVTAATTPWRPLAGGPRLPGRRSGTGLDFSADEIARADAHRRQVRRWSYASTAAGLAGVLALGFTRLGARLVEAVSAPLGGGLVVRAVLGAVAVSLALRAVVLPFDALAEAGQRKDGLSTRTWRGWAVDVTKGWSVSTVVLVALSLATFTLARALPRWWWLPAAAGAAALVVLASFVLPVLVEPLFNRFTPLPPGPLRSELLAMAQLDGVPVHDVLVADASRRTTALNAYVSGLGRTRRIVVYDTLLERAHPTEARLVVAHELGHAARRDVLHGTLTGALGAASFACVAYLGMTSPALLSRAGAGSAHDPRALPLLLACASVAGAVTGPLGTLVSRRVEARADVHALELTGDVDGFVAMQRRLAVANRSDLHPSLAAYVLFATHPTAPQRIALARAWALS